MRGDYYGLEEHLQEVTNTIYGDGGRMDAAPVILYGKVDHIEIIATRAILDALDTMAQNGEAEFEAVAVKGDTIIVKDRHKSVDEIKQILEDALSENPAARDAMYDYYLKTPGLEPGEEIPLDYM